LKALGFDPKGVGEELDGRKSRKTTSVASVEAQGTLYSYFCYQSAVCRRPVRRTVGWNLKMLRLSLLLMLAWILCGFHVEREQQTAPQQAEERRFHPQPLLATAHSATALVYVCLTVQVCTTFLTSVAMGTPWRSGSVDPAPLPSTQEPVPPPGAGLGTEDPALPLEGAGPLPGAVAPEFAPEPPLEGAGTVVVTDPLSAPVQLAMEEEHMAVEETPQEAPASELPAAGSDEVPSSPLEGNGSSAGNRSSPPIRELIQGMKFPPPEINPNVAVNPNRALAKAQAKAQSLGSLPRVKEPPVPHTSSIRVKMGLRGAERVKAPPGPRGSVSRSPAPKTVRFLEPLDETGDSGPRLLPAGAEALVSLSLARPPAPPIPIAATSQVLPASKAESTPAQAEASGQPPTGEKTQG
jgi:hypothetical protein